jgi:signal transduction histidine kinase
VVLVSGQAEAEAMTDLAAPLRRWADAPVHFWVLAVVSAALVLMVEVTSPRGFENIYDESVMASLGALALLGTVLMALAPLVALRSPWFAAAMVLPRLALVPLIDYAWPFSAYLCLLTVAMCASWNRPARAWVVAGLGTLIPVGIVLGSGRMITPYGGQVEFIHNRDAPYLLVTCLLFALGTIVAMGFAFGLRLVADKNRAAAALAGERRAVDNEAAVLDERSRLARDLHDVVAHHVSLIAVRAETAPYTYPDLSIDARLVLSEIAADSRAALDELRGVLGVLRRSDDGARRTPQPSANDISELVLKAQSTTDVVSASLQGLETVQPTPGYVAYRVVQEALTNARRHAPGAPADVTAHGDGTGGIRVLVTNQVPEPTGASPGRGLTGMAERVAAIGGELDTGVRAGEFVVEARLPAVPRNASGATS